MRGVFRRHLRTALARMEESLRRDVPPTKGELLESAEELRSLESAIDAASRLQFIYARRLLIVVVVIVPVVVGLLSAHRIPMVPVDATIATGSVRLSVNDDMAFGGDELTAGTVTDVFPVESLISGDHQHGTTIPLTGLQLHRLSLPKGSVVQLTLDRAAATFHVVPDCPGEDRCKGGRLVASKIAKRSSKPNIVVLWLGSSPRVSLRYSRNEGLPAFLGSLDIAELSIGDPAEQVTSKGMRAVANSDLSHGVVRRLSVEDSVTIGRRAQLAIAGPRLTVDEMSVDKNDIILSVRGDARSIVTTVGDQIRDNRPSLLRIVTFRIGESVTLTATLLGVLVAAILWYVSLSAGRAP